MSGSSPTAWLWAPPGAEGRETVHFPSSGPAGSTTPPRLLQNCILKRKQNSSEEVEFSQRASKTSSRACVPQTPNWVQVGKAAAGTLPCGV